MHITISYVISGSEDSAQGKWGTTELKITVQIIIISSSLKVSNDLVSLI